MTMTMWLTLTPSGDLFWFRFGNRVLRSYMDPSLEPLERIEFAFYAMFAVEAWYTDLRIKNEAAKRDRKAAKEEEKKRVCKEMGWTVKRYNEEQKKLKAAEKERAQLVDAEPAAAPAKRKRSATKTAATAAIAPAAVAPPAAAPPPAEFEEILSNGLVMEVRVRGDSEKRLTQLFVQNTVPAKPPTVAMQFITRPAAIGIALNAWFLLAFVYLLCQFPDLRKTIPFVTRLLTEQGAEKVFRALRAVLGGENFTLSDFFRRFDRVMALAILRAIHEGVNLRFPDHECSFRWDETQPADAKAGLLPDSVTMDKVTTAILRAKNSVVKDMLTLGLDVAKLPRIDHLDVAGALADVDGDDDSPAPTDLVVAAPTDADFAHITTNLLVAAEPRSVRPILVLIHHVLTLINCRAATVAWRLCPPRRRRHSRRRGRVLRGSTPP